MSVYEGEYKDYQPSLPEYLHTDIINIVNEYYVIEIKSHSYLFYQLNYILFLNIN